MSTIEFHLLTTAEHEEALSDQLMLLGAAAITSQDAGCENFYEPKPGEYLQWKETRLIALFEDDTSQAAITDYLTQLQTQRMLKEFNVRTVEDLNWVAHTQRQFPPQSFGKRLWVCPSWESPPVTEAVNIILDPGCAFGTGTHPTTSLCLKWLDTNIKGGETIIDYGCGSGILAIAALKLGAKHAIAVDHDPEAIEVTKLNAAQNKLSAEQLTVLLPEDFQAPPVDLLVANIIAGPLISLEPLFAALVKPAGKIVLSGILENQIDDIQLAYAPHFSQIEFTQEGEWIRISAVKL